MFRFWESFTRPLLDALEPHVLVEVGAFEGEQTRLLAEWAADHEAVVHSIDPEPAFDPNSIEGLRFHAATSLEALSAIDSPDAVLIDGDHNWFTVFHELTTIDEAAGDGPLPLVLLHDVGWPYGRRDLYYAPDRIPEEYRHPHGTGGMIPGQSRLAATGGFNVGKHQALHEGGARNGVLTAVEDFVAATARDLDLAVIPGLFGYGILVDRARLDGKPRLVATIDTLRPSAHLHRHLEALEWWRVMGDLA